MPVYDGNQMAHEYLLSVAQKAVVAALKAPQITGKSQVKAEIVTGDDLWPFVECLGILGETSDFIRGDHVTIKKNLEKGTPPVVVLLGADCTVSSLNWNCGACGRESCADFNKWSKEEQGMGSSFTGPSCVWKTVDLGTAVDWACAAVWHENVDNRVQDSVGAVGGLLGYCEGCNMVIGLSLGPPADQVWYNRPDVKHDFNMADIRQMLFRTVPQHFLSFCGDGNPAVKYANDWLPEPKYQFLMEDEELLNRKGDQYMRLGEVIMRVSDQRRAQREAAAREGEVAK